MGESVINFLFYYTVVAGDEKSQENSPTNARYFTFDINAPPPILNFNEPLLQ